jgi:type II secretory pathway pseudopilin PulG
MELLAVVAIIVIIAGAAVIAVPGIIDGVKRDRAKADCKTLEKAITSYNLQNPDVPLTDNDWSPLLQGANNQKAILEPSNIIDPWRQQYHFMQNQTQTGRPKVWSAGPPGGQEISNLQP